MTTDSSTAIAMVQLNNQSIYTNGLTTVTASSTTTSSPLDSSNVVQGELKRRITETNIHNSDVEERIKTSRYTENSESVQGVESTPKVEDVEVDVAQHVEVRQSDDMDSDGMDDDDGVDRDPDTASDHRVYPCPMTSSGGRPRKHPALPPKYRCDYCGRGCQKPSVLAKHIRAHTNERPYPCELCGFAFKTKSNLYKHSKSKTHHDKLNSVLQAKRLGSLADGATQLHVASVARSADSESPDSDSHQRDTLPRTCAAMPTDGRRSHNELNTCDDDSRLQLQADCTTDGVSVRPDWSSRPEAQAIQASMQSARLTSEKHANAVALDVNRSVKARLRNHIEQKQVDKISGNDGPPSPGPRGTTQYLLHRTTSQTPNSSSLINGAEDCQQSLRQSSGKFDSGIFEGDDERDLRGSVDSSLTFSENNGNGALNVLRGVRLESSLSHSEGCLTNRAICSADTKPSESTFCKMETMQLAAPLSAGANNVHLRSSNIQDSQLLLPQARLPSVRSNPTGVAHSKIDVLIEATDLINTRPVSSIIKTEQKPFVLSSLDLLAAAAEVASRMDEASASGVPSPAAHVDIINASLGITSPLSKTQASVSQSNTSSHNDSRNYECQVCAKSFAKEHFLALHLKAHADMPYRCGNCRQSYSELSRLKQHQASEGHYASLSAAGSSAATVATSAANTHSLSVSVSNLTKQEYSARDNDEQKPISHSSPHAPNVSHCLLAQGIENASANSAYAYMNTSPSAAKALSEKENPKLCSLVRQLDTPLVTKVGEKQQLVDNTFFSPARNNTGQQPSQQTFDEQSRAAIPVGAVSIPHIPYLATSSSGLASRMTGMVDPKNILLVGGTPVGMPVGLPGGPLIAAFALPFGGYTLLPAAGGLYVAAQPQTAAVGPSVSVSGSAVLIPTTTTAATTNNNNHNYTTPLRANVSVNPTLENHNFPIALTPPLHSSASATGSGSDRDNMEFEGGTCTSSRPFRCETCNRGFRVQGHLNKHMRSKTHLENVAK